MGACTSQPHKSKHHPPLASVTRSSSVFESYHVSRQIGVGAFGVVRKGCSRNNQSLKVAIKTIDKSKLGTPDSVRYLRSEIHTLSKVDHPNIIRLYEAFEDDKYLHLVTEYCSGGELMTKLIERGKYSEHDAATLLLGVLRAINHLHINGICHRDIKPENFLFANRTSQSELKLIDFGLASRFLESPMKTVVGTPSYIAPEVLRGKAYSSKCDMWSFGVLMYVMLSGSFPFYSENRVALLDTIRRAEYELTGPTWNSVSDDAKDLIRRLLVKSPKERIDGTVALSHPWFTTATSARVLRVDEHILSTLKAYRAPNKLKTEAMQVLLRFLNYHELKDLREAFLQIDTGNTGFLSYEEVALALERAGNPVTAEELSRLVRELDSAGDGRVNYTEFLAATLTSKIELNDDLIWSVFQHFDRDQSGYITAANIAEELQTRGKSINNEDLTQLIREVDLQDVDGQISYEEFKHMLLKNTAVTSAGLSRA